MAKNKLSGFLLLLLGAAAPALEAAEIAEIEKLLEKQFKADPNVFEGMLKAGHGFAKSLNDLAKNDATKLVASALDGFQKSIEDEAKLHNITL